MVISDQFGPDRPLRVLRELLAGLRFRRMPMPRREREDAQAWADRVADRIARNAPRLAVAAGTDQAVSPAS